MSCSNQAQVPGGGSGGGAGGGAAGGTSVQEYSIRVPKNVKKRFHVMRFNSVLNVDFTKWSQVKMERENNMREFKTTDDDLPKVGAGSEFGREAREEARRKKCGIIMKRYRVDDQPWILKSAGKAPKKFKGIREGGVGENAAYYVFTHATDGGIEAYPLCEWYNFHPVQRYKALSAEEAEQEFGRRNKVMNYFNLMLRKRLRKDEDCDLDEGDDSKPAKPNNKRHSADLKISEMDEWLESGDEDSDSDGDGLSQPKQNKDNTTKKNKKKSKVQKKKKKGSDESAFEESDDGDEEGRELDYISDSSDSESDSDKKVREEMKGVAEETALRKLLTSDEEEEDEENKEKDKEERGEDGAGSSPPKDNKKKKVKTKSDKKPDDDSWSDSSEQSQESNAERDKDILANGGNSEANTPEKGGCDKVQGPAAKKQKLDVPSTPLSYGGESGITEEAVRRYLMRKPMTTTELLQKFKGRKTGLSSDQLVNIMTQILKRINPTKQMIKSKMYLSIKPV